MVLVTLFSHVVTFTIFKGGVELSGQDVEQTIIVHESEQNDQRGIYANTVPYVAMKESGTVTCSDLQ
jgi:hypothetical protein